MPIIEKYQKYINKARETEKKYNIPTNTLVGLLSTESNFNPNAISQAKAKGIAQFMDGTAKEYKIDPYNTDQAIDAAGKYLQSSYKQLGDWDEAILSYNAGVGGVKQYRAGKPMKSKEHREYVGKVKTQMARFGSIPTTKTQSEDYANSQLSQENYTQQTQYLPTQQRQDVATLETEDKVDLEADTQKLQEQYNEKEKLFLNEYNTLFADNEQEIPQEEIQQQEQPKANYLDIYNQVSDFVDSPLAQQGGQKDIYGNDITAKIVSTNEDRSTYDGRTNTIKTGNDYRTWVKDEGSQEKLIAHENYHGKQLKDDRTNYDIAYNTDNKFWAQMQKRPEMMSTDDLWRNFHNRKDIESNIAVNDFSKQIPEAEFFRNAFGNIAFNKKVERNQYFNPTTEEGEAMYYENTGKEFYKFQQGGTQYTQNEIDFLSEIAIKDNKGQLKYPGEITQIASPNITMKNVKQALLAIPIDENNKQVGKTIIMNPNKDYYFPKAKKVIEIPLNE